LRCGEAFGFHNKTGAAPFCALVATKGIDVMKIPWRLLLPLLLAWLAAPCVLAPPAPPPASVPATIPNWIPPAALPGAAPSWRVRAVDQAAKTVTLTNGKTLHTYKLVAMPKITINGQPGKLENVQKGMKVDTMTISSSSISVLALLN
jgi:hypothetical protein